MPRLARVSLKPVLLAGVALAAIVALAPHGARAQLLDQFIAPDVPGTGVQPEVTVASRQRPDYDPLGVRYGNVTVRPALNESFGYDDNVSGSKRPRGSALIETNALVGANFDKSTFHGTALLSVDDVEYPSQSQQSYTNWTAQAGGSYEFNRDVLSFQVSHQNLTQTQQDLDVPRLSQALAYRVDSLKVGYRIDLNRWFVMPALNVYNFSYDNGLTPGAVYQQSFRDRVVINPTVTGGYQFGRAALVGVLRDAVGEFTGPRDGIPRQNFNDVSALGGIDFDATGFLRYRLLAGYEVRTFESSAYKTLSAPIVEATVIWSPTGLTTVTAEAARRIQDSTDQSTTSLTESAFAARVDHELRRNVLLRGNLSYIIDQYGHSQGQQALAAAGGSVTYLVNRNLQLAAGYIFSARRTSGNFTAFAASNFNDNRVLLTVRLAL